MASEAADRVSYPVARRADHQDTYHGVTVPDPYRWLEDLDSAETKTWVEAENKATFAFLETIASRAEIKERLTSLWNYERYGVPSKEGGRYFFTRNDGLQNQAVLYTVSSLEAEPRVLLDPNTLSKDGTVALAGTAVSDDGKHLAYGVAEAGSDWNTWRVRSVDSATDLPDTLRWVKFSGASWTKDGKGFFYSRYAEPVAGSELKNVNLDHKLYYHKLGTPQSEDVLVYERKDQPEWLLGGSVTEDGRYLVIGVAQGKTKNTALFYKDLAAPGAPVVELLSKFDAEYGFVDNDGPVFWVQADKDAPRGRVFAIDTTKPEPKDWTVVIPESADALQSVTVVGERFFASYLKDARSVVRTFDLRGKPLSEVELPGIGTAGGFGGKRTDTETFFYFTSYTAPTTIYRHDVTAGKSQVFRAPRVAFDAAAYETRQVFYKSKDGTQVPMFLTHKKGLKHDGSNPTLLYGYGGFNVSLTPAFSISNLLWLERGGVYAVANLRGGGEYGEEWHQAGTKLKKQNVFDDFIAAAEWLVASKVTNPKRLAIAGGSNGGLLVGAVLNQRPELFGAAIPAVGVMDMLRFHKFTIGWAWVSDYGSSDDPKEYAALRAYSPYHNLKDGACYPPTLVTTADHDDRVFPAHSFKYAAALQKAQGCDKPVLIRIETRAGHGAGKPTAKIIEEAADVWAFLQRALGMEPGPPVLRPLEE
ncbi:MAG TPA: prolyl oligopeptidase family serine peptidase [Vicinamibacteria bacterium]